MSHVHVALFLFKAFPLSFFPFPLPVLQSFLSFPAFNGRSLPFTEHEEEQGHGALLPSPRLHLALQSLSHPPPPPLPVTRNRIESNLLLLFLVRAASYSVVHPIAVSVSSTVHLAMGLAFSGFIQPSEVGSHQPQSPSLGDIPENCVSSILNCMDPPEICRLAGVNRAFRGASSADLVWESKLPSNYKFLVEKVLGDSQQERSSKKQIYARLCRPNCFDGGTKVGNNCFS